MLALLRLGLVAAPLAAQVYGAKSTVTVDTSSIFAASSSVIAGTTATPYPMPVPCTGAACTEFPTQSEDFSVIQHQNGTWFRASKDNGYNTGLVLATAPALAGPWVIQQPIFGPQGNTLLDFQSADANQTNLWVPELHYQNGLYYVFYALFDRATNGLGFQVRVATSPSMADNSWTDHGNIGLPKVETANIGPSVMADYDSNPYGIVAPYSLMWGSWGAGLYGINLYPSNLTQLDPTSSATMLIQDQLYPVAAANSHHIGNNRTGSTFHMQMNGWVFVFYDLGQCCSKTPESAYTIQMCRGTNSSGPFYDKNGKDCAGNANGTLNGSGSTILQSHSPDANGDYQVLSPGSVGIVGTPEGPVFTYQYRNQTQKLSSNNPGLAFNFGYNYINFDSQGWPFLSSTPQALSSGNGTLPGVLPSGTSTATTTTTDGSNPSATVVGTSGTAKPTSTPSDAPDAIRISWYSLLACLLLPFSFALLL